MKRSLTLLFLLWCLIGSAQSNFRFADSTAQWNVLEEQYYMPGHSLLTFKYFVVGDTVVNGMQYQKVECPGGSGFGFYPTGIALIRKDTVGRVYRKTNEDTADVLIYDFEVAIHDTIVLPSWQLGMYSPIQCVVQSIDTVMMAKKRKRLTIQYIKAGSYSNDLWIEGIGATTSHWLAPGMERSISDGPADTLLCFYESSTLSYSAPGHNLCEVNYTSWASLNDHTLLSTEEIFFNSDNHSIEIRRQNVFQVKANFNIYNLTGRLILQKELTEQTTRIDLCDMARGVYVYNIQLNGQKIKTGKLMIE